MPWTAEASRSFPPVCRLRDSVVLKYLDAPVEGIDHVNAIVIIDLQASRQLKLLSPGSLASEVIQQLSLLVENLHYAPLSVDDIEM
jgi:hypothetical protein